MNRLPSSSYRRKLTFFIGFVAASLLMLPVRAAVLISQSDTVPPRDVFLSIAASGTGNSALNGYNAGIASAVRELGQVFQAPGTVPVTLAAFTLQLTTSVKTGSPGAAMTVTIYALDSGTDLPSGTPLYQQSGDLPDTMTLGNYLSFTLDQPVMLTAGSYYAIQIGFTTIAAEQSFNVVTGNDYLNGRAFYYANTPNPSVMSYIGQSSDLKMSLQTIPEPGTMLFFGVGLGMVILWRGRRA